MTISGFGFRVSSGVDAFAALATANSLTTIGLFRGDSGVTGTSGTGKASWAPVAGTMSAITPHGSATNGIGSVSAGLGGKAGVLLDGSTQKGAYTAPVLAVPGTTNWHRYWIARQIAGTGGVRLILSETGNVYMVQFATSVQVYAYGCQSNGNLVATGTWQRGRVSCTGASTGEIKIGNQTPGTGGTGAVNTAPDTARQFGDLGLNWEWLMYGEFTGTKANFLTFAAAADSLALTTWTSAIEI